MGKGRLEAFSDGVLAIIITIMVLELKAPHNAALSALQPLWPVLLSYVLSFVYVGIYWNNHHHLIKAARRTTGPIMWANLHLLFWLSLTPFITAWMGENHFAPIPTALYGVVFFFSATAYFILQCLIVADLGQDSRLASALKSDFKGKMSLVAYLIAILVSCWMPFVACSIYAAVALTWMIPDRRLATVVEEEPED